MPFTDTQDWETKHARRLSTVVGSIVAAACADSLGWPTERLRTPAAVRREFGVDRVTGFVGWRKTVGGRFNAYLDYIAPGEYSDDTQLALSLARAIRANGELDHEYFAKGELVSWLDYSRGAGRAVTAAARKMARVHTPWNLNFFHEGKLDYRESGANGVAMRIAPLALANLHRADPPLADAFLNGITTHGHPRAHVGALALTAALHNVAERAGTVSIDRRDLRESVIDALRGFKLDALPDHGQMWIEEYARTGKPYPTRWLAAVEEMVAMVELATSTGKTETVLAELGCFERATRGSGTATTAAAIHLFLIHGGEVESTLEAAANAIGADTDTIGAIAGALAGAWVGYEQVPARWVERLQDLPYLISLGTGLAALGVDAERAPDTPLRARILPEDREFPDPLGRLRDGVLEPGQRVLHDVLGMGTVIALHDQETRRRGGRMAYARVALDIGQTVQLKAYRRVA